MARQRSVLTERVWRERLRRFGQRGVAVAEFCEDEGVSTASFYNWRRRLRGGTARDPGHTRQAGPERADPGQAGPGQSASGQALFVPVAVRSMMGEVRIDVAEGVVLRLPLTADERLLGACLRAVLDATSRGEGR